MWFQCSKQPSTTNRHQCDEPLIWKPTHELLDFCILFSFKMSGAIEVSASVHAWVCVCARCHRVALAEQKTSAVRLRCKHVGSDKAKWKWERFWCNSNGRQCTEVLVIFPLLCSSEWLERKRNRNIIFAIAIKVCKRPSLVKFNISLVHSAIRRNAFCHRRCALIEFHAAQKWIWFSLFYMRFFIRTFSRASSFCPWNELVIKTHRPTKTTLPIINQKIRLSRSKLCSKSAIRCKFCIELFNVSAMP